MIGRCYRKSQPDYDSYGGRGITVCDRWRNSYKDFLADMGERPEGTSIDRLNTNGNYEPCNCKWSTAEEQQNNKRNSIKIPYNDELISVKDFSLATGIPETTIRNRIFQKVPLDKLNVIQPKQPVIKTKRIYQRDIERDVAREKSRIRKENIINSFLSDRSQTYKTIADLYGVNINTVRNYLMEAGLYERRN
jgi:hypothetical protein